MLIDVADIYTVLARSSLLTLTMSTSLFQSWNNQFWIFKRLSWRSFDNRTSIGQVAKQEANRMRKSINAIPSGIGRVPSLPSSGWLDWTTGIVVRRGFTSFDQVQCMPNVVI